MYVAIKRFSDLTDDDHIYDTGDVYPRDGFEPSRERIIELATSKNKLETHHSSLILRMKKKTLKKMIK